MDDEEQVVSFPFEDDELDESNQIYRTYRMDFDRKRISGMIDGQEAVAQAIWKILSTTRFAYMIYDDQYGCDFFNKINSGLTDDFIASDMPAMIEDALSCDPRITGVTDFSYEIISHDSVHVKFVAETIYGDLQMEGVIVNGS
jgi:phage baseplate assembly protein W